MSPTTNVRVSWLREPKPPPTPGHLGQNKKCRVMTSAIAGRLGSQPRASRRSTRSACPHGRVRFSFKHPVFFWHAVLMSRGDGFAHAKWLLSARLARSRTVCRTTCPSQPGPRRRGQRPVSSGPFIPERTWCLSPIPRVPAGGGRRGRPHSPGSLRVSRSSVNGSSSGGSPRAMARPRASSALNSAPISTAVLEIHIQIRKMITPARLP